MWQKIEYMCVDKQPRAEGSKLLQKRRSSYKTFRNLHLLADVLFPASLQRMVLLQHSHFNLAHFPDFIPLLTIN